MRVGLVWIGAHGRVSVPNGSSPSRNSLMVTIGASTFDVWTRLGLDGEAHVADYEVDFGAARKPRIREPPVESPVVNPRGTLVAHPVLEGLSLPRGAGRERATPCEPVHDPDVRKIELRCWITRRFGRERQEGTQRPSHMSISS